MRFLKGLFAASVSASCALSLGGCAWEKKEADVEGKTVKVQIPFAVDGSYQLGVVELFTLKEVKSLKGLAARFLLDPLTRNGLLTGRAPEIRYIRDQDGVIVAKDVESLQLITLYTHAEKLKNLDEKLGAGNILSYPRTIAVNARLRRAGVIEQNNAIYSGQYDALMIEPYTQNALPLMANAGVIGHEHFHSLFQKLVIDPLKDKYPDPTHPTLHNEEKMKQEMGLIPSQMNLPTIEQRVPPGQEEAASEVKKRRTLYHAALFRGINEGLADVWGWIYSGDQGFVGRTIPAMKSDRTLEGKPTKIFSQDQLYWMTGAHAQLEMLETPSYQLGTQLARTIQTFAKLYASRKQVSVNEVRPEIGRIVLRALDEIQKNFAALKEDELFNISQAIDIFFHQVKDLESTDCAFLSSIMTRSERKLTDVIEKCKPADGAPLADAGVRSPEETVEEQPTPGRR